MPKSLPNRLRLKKFPLLSRLRQLQNPLLPRRNNHLRIVCIGLGNPGHEYEKTRHNVGFLVLDNISQRLDLFFKKPLSKPYLVSESGVFTFVKPLTFMNRSGEIFQANPDFLPGQDQMVLVLCDNMDLPPGALRLKKRGGTAGHNGLKSIAQYIGDDFNPLYIGVGRPDPGVDVITHVLGVAAGEESSAIEAAVARAAEGLLRLPDAGFELTMNILNTRTE